MLKPDKHTNPMLSVVNIGGLIIEQIKNEKVGVSKDNIEKFLGRMVSTSVDKLFRLLSERNAKESLNEIERAVSEGMEVSSLITSMLDGVRVSLLFRSGIGEKDNLDYFKKDELLLLADLLIKAGRDTQISYIEQLPLEVMIIRWCESMENENVFGDSEERKEEEINKEIIKKHLYTRNFPEVDYIIRTGMEDGARISGFLLWDASYAEFKFRSDLWPDYSREMVIEDLKDFCNRVRRKGK